jgi:asparagine synthase (glutamine-hydrolysing)
MCGLFGFVNLREAAQGYLPLARASLTSLAHRGPDQWRDYIRDNVYMGHRRLSILDLSEHGAQPMISRDGNIVSTVNGEIYNYPKLRAELPQVQFESHCDSEIVPHGYREWGAGSLLDRMDGMYALALYDRAEQKLVIARDRVGIKPLYYATVGPWFVWASELKAIEMFLRDASLQVDGTALYDLLTYRYIPSPKSLYRNVYKLPPAHMLELDVRSGQSKLTRYWQLPAQVVTRSVEDAAAEMRALVGKSVNEQLASDVPLGCFLSGGIDSTVIAGTLAKLRNNAPVFTIGFDEPSYDETRYAKIAADAFGFDMYTRQLERDDGHDLLARMRALYDEPHGDYSVLPTWHVSKLARERVTVVLSGDGGDELFGGYSWYERIARIRRARGPLAGLMDDMMGLPYIKRPKGRAAGAWNRLVLWGGSGLFELYTILMNAVPWHVRKSYRSALGVPHDYDDFWNYRRHYRPELGVRRSLQYLDFHTYLPDDILTKVDRASMAVSLECRVPYLSRELVEFAFSLDESFLYLNGRLKGGMKYAFKDLLPVDIESRGKKGFGIPVQKWELLGDSEAFELGVLKSYLPDSAALAVRPS